MSGYKFKILLICLLAFNFAKGQIPVNRSPSSVQVRDARLQAYLNLIAPRYSDTTHANTNKGLDSLGAIIYDSTSNNFYFRGVNATMGHKWIAFGSGGGGTDWYTTDGSFTSTRTADLNNKLVQFTSTGTNTTSEFDINITNSTFNTSTFFSRGIGSAQSYAASLTTINGVNENTTYAELYGANNTLTHTNRIRTYPDSMIFNSYNGLYRFRNAVTSTDTTTYKPLALDQFGNLVQISSWNNGRPLYARNALRARNDSTITWNGLLDTNTLINGSATYPLKFSGILGGVKFDENPTFNTTSTTGYVWTAVNSSGLGAWQASTGSYIDPLTTNGDLLRRASGITSRLAIGSEANFLKVIGGLPAWGTAPGNPNFFNFLDYGGVNDGIFARHASATSGSATITCNSCTFNSNAHAGQAFRMDSAGASGAALVTTILSVTDDHHIVLNTTAGTSVASKSIVWGTDNGAAANNFLDTVRAHGGGTAFFPIGIYVIASALRTSVNGVNPNCQIYLPQGTVGDSLSWANKPSILLVGGTLPSAAPISTAYDTASPHTGTIIESIIDGTNTAGNPAAAIFGTRTSGTTGSGAGANGVNYAYYRFQNMTIYVPQNAGAGNGPKIGGINCYYCSSVQTQDVVVSMDGSALSSSNPTNDVAGIITNQYASEITTTVINTHVSGFKYGLVTSDHSVLLHYQAEFDYYALTLPSNAYPVTVLEMGDQQCAVGIYSPATGAILGNIPAGGTASVNILQWQIESPVPAQWYSRVVDLRDTSNLLLGKAYFYNTNNAGQISRFNGTGMILAKLGEEGDVPTADHRTLTIGNATTTAAELLVRNVFNGAAVAGEFRNTSSGAFAENIVRMTNDLGSGSNKGVYLGLLSSTFGSPFNSAFRIYDYDGPLYFAGNGTRTAYVSGTGWKFANSAVAPDASAMVDIASTTQGMLAPRMTTTQQNAISSPATGLLIYNTDSSLFRFYNGSAWTSIASGSGGGGGGGGTPGGSNTQVQYNNSGSFGGISGATSNGTNIFIPTLYGGSSSGGDLTLASTSHATKGKIILDATRGTYYSESAGNLAIGSSVASNYAIRAVYSDLTGGGAIFPGIQLINSSTTSPGGGQYNLAMTTMTAGNTAVTGQFAASYGSGATAPFTTQGFVVGTRTNDPMIFFQNSAQIARVDATGFNPFTSATFDLGTSSLKWNSLYLTNLVGTTTNNNAASGAVGQYVESLIALGSAVSLTTVTAANVTSISLTAGDWDVTGSVSFNETGATVAARSAGISSTTATIPSDGTEVYLGAATVIAGEFNSITPARKRFSLSGTTTVYLTTQVTFTAGTVTAFGNITARRIR